ncbi:MAG: hypothetical protein DWQ21_09405 [Bacteroidetes bacterium]|nr:MAG: hypothetical protein DWQ21_09405 [Bacteroidota bacterium]REK61324.1 MAG: hypothetical protein DWQ49_04585 [Bacteroidota bacterium]
MAKWTVKGIVDDNPKSKQETEQAVLDKAVEEGKIEPQSAGQEEEVPKINLDELNKQADAVQEQSTDEVPVRDEPEASKEVQQEDKQETAEEPADESPLELIKEEEEETQVNDQPKVDQRAAEVNKQPEPVQEQPQAQLPENVEKLVKFMEETGGTVEDYVRLNRDVSELPDGDVLREYYSQSKPWDLKEIQEYMEDNFSFDEDVDSEKEIRAKKRAFKEELYNARKFFETNKEKYYADLKLSRKQEIPQEYQEAYENYSEYKQGQELNSQLTKVFLEKTDNVFSGDFKGFDFQVGDNKFRYKVSNVNETKEVQSDISNFIKPYLNDKGEMADAKGYHKALFTARNADKLAQHFYEQGRADALRQSAKEAKNIDMNPRQEGTIQTKSGQKFRVVSGDSSSKLKIKLNK